MRTTRLAPALLVCAAALAFAAPVRAQEEAPPPAATPAQEGPRPSAAPPAPPAPRLRPALDYARWQEMSPRERQTFVEGALMSLQIVSIRLRTDLGLDGAVPPERLAALVRFVREYYPRFPTEDYLREMDHIYLTPEGQNLSMSECFLQAYRRINGR